MGEDAFRNVDFLLSSYRKEVDQIINKIKNDPVSLIHSGGSKGIVKFSDRCDFTMGKYNKTGTSKCVACLRLARIVPTLKGSEIPFVIEYGKMKGTRMVVEEELVKFTFVERKEVIRINKLCSFSENEPEYYLACDDFTLSNIIQWSIQDAFEKEDIPHYRKLYYSFICNEIGFRLYKDELLSMNSIEIIPHEIVIQLLSFYANTNLSLGLPLASNLGFINHPCSYTINGKDIIGKFTLIIRNFNGSSATLGNVHYYNRKDHLNQRYVNNTIDSRLIYEKGCGESCDNDVVYKIRRNSMEILSKINHSGVQSFNKSFDIYSFIVSLMCDKDFREAAIEDKLFMRFWKLLWMNNDDQKIMDRINDLVSSSEYEDVEIDNIYDILDDIWIRCDILRILWEKF